MNNRVYPGRFGPDVAAVDVGVSPAGGVGPRLILTEGSTQIGTRASAGRSSSHHVIVVVVRAVAGGVVEASRSAVQKRAAVDETRFTG